MKEALPISELEELSLSGLLPERLVVCVCACGVVYSCGSSIRGDSILIAQQPKEWREWGKKRVEIDWHMLHPGYYLQSFVDGSVLQREVCAVPRKYSAGSGISRKHSRVKWS